MFILCALAIVVVALIAIEISTRIVESKTIHPDPRD